MWVVDYIHFISEELNTSSHITLVDMWYKPECRQQYTIWFDKEFKKNLERLAVSKRMTMSTLIHAAAEEYLQRETKTTVRGEEEDR